MMHRVILLALLGLGFAGLAQAQETTGPKAEAVKKEILKVEEEKLKAFQSTGAGKNFSAEWVQANDAEGIVHINADGTDDTKAGSEGTAKGIACCTPCTMVRSTFMSTETAGMAPRRSPRIQRSTISKSTVIAPTANTIRSTCG